MSDTNHSGAQLLLTFMAGAAAGAVAALLLAPKSGRETQAGLRTAAHSLTDAASRVPSALREAGAAASTTFHESMGKNT